MVISAAKIEQGILVARVRTTNLLYLSSGLLPAPAFEPEQEIRIDEMWHWTGERWGGLPDGTSLADRMLREQSDTSDPELGPAPDRDKSTP